MKHRARFLSLFAAVSLTFGASLHAEPYLMENLGRGMVVVRSSATEAYVGWRLLATDPTDIAFNLYRATGGGAPALLNGTPITATTNYVDAAADLTQANEYSLRPVIGGIEQPSAGSFTLPANAAINQYLTIPLQIPPGGVTPVGGAYTYSANDASVADLDGDGEYEIVLKWDPSNSQDNANDGYTGNVYLDAYKLNGTRLWRIDLGRNIRAGAHYTQFMVYDLDGDGKAEVACKTADATVDGVGTVIGDGAADYRSTAGRILTGPEFLTIFNGETGAALATTNYNPPRGDVCLWGNDSAGRPECYGNRVDRFLAAIAYLDGQRPSLVMCRGYYDRAVLAAWNWRGGVLTNIWTFDSKDGTPGNDAYSGQGNHNLSVADVDGDGRQEIIYGAASIDDDGTGLYATGLGHGDALHVSDMDPDRPGLEVLQPHEVPSAAGAEFRDARTGGLIWGVRTASDNGRGMADDIDPTRRGFEMWTAQGVGVRDRVGAQISTATPPMNFAVWWDADPLREMLDQSISTLGPVILSKWNWTTNTSTTLLSLPAAEVMTNNSTKANPVLTGDILGDWREEIILRAADSSALRIYTTIIPATNRLYTLMQDPQYRVAMAWQNVGYNQPPHPSFFFGDGMAPPPIPDIITDPGAPARPSTPLILTVTTDSGVSATDRITNDNTLVLGGTADAGNTVTVSKVGVGVIGTTPADGTGAWSFDYSGTPLAEGSHFFTATADDGLGHTSGAMPPFQVYVDTVAPTVLSSNRLNPLNEVTSADTVVFRVTFSERVAGVTPASFVLTATGSATGTISTVSGAEGNFIDVTVISLGGIGTLRLDVPATLTDVAGTPVSAAFVTGEIYSLLAPSWIQAVSGGLWSDAANWSGGIIADGLGLTAKFSVLDLTEDNTVHLDTPRTLGGLRFGDTDVTTPGSWVIDNNGVPENIVTLAVASGVPAITVNAMGTGAGATISASLASTAGLLKDGAGVAALAGPNTIAGTPTVTGGVLRVASGGTLAVTGVNVGPNGAQLNVAGGLFSATGNVRVTPGAAAGVYVDSGTATFNTIDTTNTAGGVVRFNGGAVTANSITLPRSADGTPSYATGLIITGGSTTVGTLGIATNNSNASMSVEGGSVLVTGAVTLGNQSSSGRGGHMRVTGGTFTSTDTTSGIIITRRTTNTSDANFLGGISTIEKILLGYDNTVVAGSATLALNDGTLYVGSGGIVKNGAAGLTTTINLTGGTVGSVLGAKASWSSSVPMTLLGTSTTLALKAADPSDAPYDIGLGGVLSGVGGFTKTGGGTLTLSATNTFTGAVDVNAGLLAVTGSLAAGSGPTVGVNVNSGGTLTGAGAISRPVVLATGGRIVPGNGTAASTLTAQSLTWNGGGTLVSSYTTGGLLAVTGALVKSGTGQVVELSTSTPLTVGDTITLATFASTDLLVSDLVLSGLMGYQGSFVVNPTSLQFIVQHVGSPTSLLDVSVTGTGGGSGVVTSSPAGIDCGVTCSATFAWNAVVTLTATPTAGSSSFTGWGGACSGTLTTCDVTMEMAKSVTAEFALNTYALDVTLSGTGSGAVTSSPAGIDCGSDCSETYGHGTTVTLTATPATGVRFGGWSGACTGTALTCDVSMDAAKSVTATFIQAGYFTVSPCRVFDSRSTAALAAGSEAVVTLHGTCGVPSSALTVSVNITVTGPTVAGYLTLFADGAARPAVSALNFGASQTRGNNAVVSLGTTGALRAYLGQSTGTAHVIIDVNGYFE